MITIYLRTNTVNGMQYVGQTNDMNRRERDWNCLKKQKYANYLLSKDREKYGLDKWESKVLKECDDSEGDYWERYYIKELNTKFPNGYNMGDGGKGAFGVVHTEEQKNRQSQLMKGKTPWNKGKCHTEEAKKKMSETHKGKLSPMKGKKHSEEAKQKMSDNKKGKPNTKLEKKVYQYTTENKLVAVWNSTMDCGRNGFSQGHVASCCRGERKQHKGYKWSYKPL